MNLPSPHRERLRLLLKSFKPIKRKAGRPSKLKPVVLDKVCQLRGDGCSWSEIAEAIGVNKDTINEWLRHDAGFRCCADNAFRRFQKRELLEHGVHRITA